MGRRAFVGLAVFLGLFCAVSAQLADPGPSRNGPFSFSFHNSFGHGRHGFLGGGRHGGFGFGFGPFFVPQHFGFRTPFVFGGSFRGGRSQLADPDGFRFHAGPYADSSFFFDPFYGYNYSTVVGGTRHGGWDWFVEEWADKDPVPPEEDSSSGLGQSLLLKEGMSQEEVIRALGSPIQRVGLGSKEIWKYSGYSLVFEDGVLKEMR